MDNKFECVCCWLGDELKIVNEISQIARIGIRFNTWGRVSIDIFEILVYLKNIENHTSFDDIEF
jgi:hypothetical protein